MRIFTMIVAVAAFGSMALANGTATTTVPASPSPGAAGVSGSTTTTTTTTATTTGTMGTMGATDTSGVMVAGTTMTTMPGCPANISSDTACLVNELRASRAEIRMAALEMRGQMLVDRMNRLQVEESIFRQQITANPNAPIDRATALRLQAEAVALNNDIAAFNRELSFIPVDQRPYLAQRLNTFEVVYWQPAVNQFAQYRTNYQQTASTAYQPAYANNAWLQTWQTNYNTSLGNISTTQQTFATTRWWSGTTAAGVTTTGTPQVLGSTEMYPGTAIQPGSAIVLPAGTIIIVPQTSATVTTTSPQVMGTTETMHTGGAVTNGYPAGTGAP